VVEEIPAPRGTIFDRDGRPLAMSLASRSAFINPMKVDVGVASDLLGYLLHLDRGELYLKIKQAADAHRGYLIIKRQLSPEEYDNLLHLKSRIDWVSLSHESQRHYPNGTLAAHVLGSVDFEEKGNAGIEQGLDKELRGTPGRIRLLTDVHRRGIAPQTTIPAKPGTSLTLTLDERLQFVAEREIAAAVRAHNANSGSVVVMKPDTGDILAMASYPTFDPNVPVERGSDLKPRMNHAFSVPFEPGSVFKVITLSAALETTNLRPESPINCNGGKLTLFSRTIHDSHAGMWVVPMETVLAKSSNIGAIQVGLRVGQVNMHDYMKRFGFGQKTGLPLPGESPGKVYRLERWGKTSLASVSMGQEVSVTTLQLAQAASVVASGGMLVKPRRPHGTGAAPGARSQAGECDHDAPDDGRRGPGRYRQPCATGGLFERRQDRFRANLRLRHEALHAHLQRLVHGLRADDQSAGSGGGHAEWDSRRSRIRRPGRGAGLQNRRRGGAARLRRSQGFAGEPGHADNGRADSRRSQRPGDRRPRCLGA
jgi:cell division protein FtsI (penicillin-binding protein 3)